MAQRAVLAAVTAGLRFGFGCELNLAPEMTMADDRMVLIELIEKGADGDLVRDLLAFAAERMRELEIEAKTGVPAGVRSPARLNQRRYHDVPSGPVGRLGR